MASGRVCQAVRAVPGEGIRAGISYDRMVRQVAQVGRRNFLAGGDRRTRKAQLAVSRQRGDLDGLQGVQRVGIAEVLREIIDWNGRHARRGRRGEARDHRRRLDGDREILLHRDVRIPVRPVGVFEHHAKDRHARDVRGRRIAQRAGRRVDRRGNRKQRRLAVAGELERERRIGIARPPGRDGRGPAGNALRAAVFRGRLVAARREARRDDDRDRNGGIRAGVGKSVRTVPGEGVVAAVARGRLVRQVDQVGGRDLFTGRDRRARELQRPVGGQDGNLHRLQGICRIRVAVVLREIAGTEDHRIARRHRLRKAAHHRRLVTGDDADRDAGRRRRVDQSVARRPGERVRRVRRRLGAW